MGAAARKEVSSDPSVVATLTTPHPVVSARHYHPGKALDTQILLLTRTEMDRIAAVWVRTDCGIWRNAGGAVGLVSGHGAPPQPAVLAGDRVVPRQAPVSALHRTLALPSCLVICHAQTPVLLLLLLLHVCVWEWPALSSGRRTIFAGKHRFPGS
jgi:hypothetical protein